MTSLVCVNLKPRFSWLVFWAGFIVGVITMGLSDLTDAHLCIGECDDYGLTFSDFMGAPPSKKTDRLPLQNGD